MLITEFFRKFIKLEDHEFYLLFYVISRNEKSH